MAATATYHHKKSEAFFSPGEKKIIKIAGGCLVLITVGGVVYYFYKRSKGNKAELETLNEGTPENYAKRLKMAFDNDGWWGTNVEEVRKVFTEISDMPTFTKVADQYQALTRQGKGALFKDLEDELTSSEYSEIQAILKAKSVKPGTKPVFDWTAAQSIAQRLKAAFNYTIMGMPSTDKVAVKVALDEIPSLTGYAMVKIAYQKIFGNDLDKELDSELDVFDFNWRDIVYKKVRVAGYEDAKSPWKRVVAK